MLFGREMVTEYLDAENTFSLFSIQHSIRTII